MSSRSRSQRGELVGAATRDTLERATGNGLQAESGAMHLNAETLKRHSELIAAHEQQVAGCMGLPKLDAHASK